MQAAIMTACIAAQITQPHLVLLTNVGRRPLSFWLYSVLHNKPELPFSANLVWATLFGLKIEIQPLCKKDF